MLVKALVFIAMQIWVLAAAAHAVAATAQTITFPTPGAQNYGTAPTLTATASSNLQVSFTSSTSSVCTITSTGTLTFHTSGSCTIDADQGGDATYDPAGTVSQTFSVNALRPGAPTIQSLSSVHGTRAVKVYFAAPADDGGAPITAYKVTASAGNISETGAASPITVTGLTNGTAYSFVVTATNSAGEGPASAVSALFTPVDYQSITFPNPGNLPFGTTTTLNATASSGLPVSFTSSTPNICEIRNVNQVLAKAPGTCTIEASQSGNAAVYAAANVSQTFSIVMPGGALSIQTTSLPPATGGVQYSQTIVATGGAQPYTFSITAGSLPNGLSLNNANGTVSGIPLSSGPYNFTIQVTDQATQSASQNYTIIVNAPAITLSPATLPNGRVATAYTSTLTATGGTAPYTYAIMAGSVPAGLTLSPSGVLSGTPATAGPANFTVITTDNYGFTGSRAYSINLAYAPPVVAAKSVTTSYDTAAPIDLSGSITGAGISSVAVAMAPAHGTVSVSGQVVTYTPSPAFFGGTDSFTYTATNPGGTSAPATVTVTVQPRSPLVFTPGAGALPQAIVGTAYAATVAVTNGTAPYRYTITAGTLPAGLRLNTASGVIDGTPTAAEATSFTITAIDDLGFSGTASYSIDSAYTLPVAAGTSATTPYGTAVAIDLSGSISGADISAVAVATAPAHGSISISGQTVTYTPSAGFFGGSDSFTYTATNPAGISAPATVTVTIQPRSPLVFTPGAGALPQAIAGSAYATAIAAANGTAPYSYAIASGTLPAGLSFDATSGTISGMPTEIGTTNITVTATDQLGFSGTASYTLAVSAPAISAPSLSASVVAGTNTTVDLTAGATGGPFTDARLISLTPASAGTATIILGDTADADGTMMASLMEARRYKLRFTPSPTFSGTAVATYTLSNRYATSAPATVSFSVAALPDPTKDSDIAGLANAEAEAAKRFAAMALDNLNSHLERLHGGGCLANSWGINLNDTRSGKEKEAQAPGAADRVGASDDARDAPGKAPGDCSPFADGALAFWTGGSVNFGSTDFADRNFDYTTFGLSAGMDYRVSERFVAGLGISMGSDRSFIGDNGTRTNGLAYSAAVYGSYHPSNGVFLDGVAGYGWLRFNSKRFDTQTGDLFDGSRDGRQIFASVTAGYETTIDGVFISPYLRMSASRSSLDAFSENSAAWSAIRYGDQDIDTFTGMLGLRLGYAIPTDWGVFTPKLRLEYGHDFASGSSLSLSYVNITGSPSYLLATDASARDRAAITLGADMRIGADWTLGADYGFTVDGRNGIGPQQFRLQVGARF